MPPGSEMALAGIASRKTKMRISASESYLTFIGFLVPVSINLICPVQGQNSFGVANSNFIAPLLLPVLP
jgi:hypothetical protein